MLSCFLSPCFWALWANDAQVILPASNHSPVITKPVAGDSDIVRLMMDAANPNVTKRTILAVLIAVMGQANETPE